VIPAAFDYVVASSVEEATEQLRTRGDDARILAGGQSLIPLMRLRLAQPSMLVDIGRIPGLDGIRREDGMLVVGALVTHVQIRTSEEVRSALPLLAEIAEEVGDNQVRNLGTIGGVIAHGDAAGDYNALALMLDAEIVTTKGRHRAAGFHRDLFTTALDPDELITEVRFPVATGRHNYQKFRRRLFDWAIAGVAVQETDSGWRVGYVNLGPTPRRGTEVEQALGQGATPAEAAAHTGSAIDPADDVRATAEYKRALAATLTRRALESAS
jgi:aerobic carbon-monoxide dehydrogenase medium subunit